MNKGIPLVSSVLHPTDFSEASDKAFAHALAIALLRQTELTLLNVGESSKDDVPWSSFPPVRETLERWKLLEPGSPRSAVYEELNVEVQKIALRGSNPVRATVDYLDQMPHELVVLATEHDLANGLAISRDWRKRLRIRHDKLFQHRVTNSLSGLAFRLLAL